MAEKQEKKSGMLPSPAWLKGGAEILEFLSFGWQLLIQKAAEGCDSNFLRSMWGWKMTHQSSISCSLSSHPWSFVTHGFHPKKQLFLIPPCPFNSNFPNFPENKSLSRAQLLAPRIIWSRTILGRNRHGKGRGWLDPREEPCPVKITGKISVGRQIMNQILAWKAASTSFFFRKERIWITGSGHRNFSSCLPERKTLKRILANKFRGVSVESLTALSGKLHLCGAVSHPEIPPRKSSFA